MIKKINFILFLLFAVVSNAQLKVLQGSIIANDEVEGIHILNKTAVKYTVTDTDGSFNILAKVNDTLTISSLKYETKTVVVTADIVLKNTIKIYLTEKVNQLNEVVVGKVLSGSLGNDMSNFGEDTEVNFYDLGIPGYIGKPKTLPERKLADADGGSWGSVGIGFSLNFHKLLNRISGRTKKLKQLVILDEKDKCQKKLKEQYSKAIFESEEVPEAVIADYFYFCMDDLNFTGICERNDPTEIIPFLKEKLKAYIINLNSTED